MRRGYTVRQFEILTLLSKYGILGSKTICSLLMEKVEMNRLRETLQGMKRRNLIVRVTFDPGGSPMSYWMLPDEDTEKGRALQALGLEKLFFRHKRTRYAHIHRENFSTLVQASIERQMPRIRIYRESTSNYNDLPDYLISERAKKSYAPDLCLGVPDLNSNPSVSEGFRWLAVEVDRAYRNKKRITKRMNFYTKHTAFSGLLYLLPDEAAVKSLREIYTSRGADNSFRLPGASKTFLAVGILPGDLFDVTRMNVCCGGFEIPLSAWISLFALADTHERDSILSEFTCQTMGKVQAET